MNKPDQILENCSICKFLKKAKSPHDTDRCMKHNIDMLAFVARRDLFACIDFEQRELSDLDKLDCELLLCETEFRSGETEFEQARDKGFKIVNKYLNSGITNSRVAFMAFEFFYKRLLRWK